MSDEFQPLTVQDYAVQALATDQGSDSGSLTFPLLGLFGETGSLLSEVKKKQRDRASYLGYADAVVEELGDVLWYLTAVASRGGLSLAEIAGKLNSGFYDWQRVGEARVSFESLQPEIMPLTKDPSAVFERTLLQLAGEVGVLVTDHEADRLANNQSALAGSLIAIMRSLVRAANEAGVTLEAAAVKNLAKISDRWPRERTYPAPLDADSETEEQLPRDIYIDVFERNVAGNSYVFQKCKGLNIGDRLTDNAMTADDYRFHDVFHYAYVAVLSWSPVVRSLFRLKRKSNPRIDEAQDGARAILIEEGVTTWIFRQATELKFFENMNHGDIPFDLLKHVRQFVAGYEAEHCPLWMWEEAILQGYGAFRLLRQYRRGRIHIDMTNHALSFEPLQ